MKHNYLYDALPFLKDVEKERQEQFKEYFKSAPLWLMENFQIEELKKGTIFVREGEAALSKQLIIGYTGRHTILCSLTGSTRSEEWNF